MRVRAIDLPLSTIFRLDFGTVPTVLFFSILFHQCHLMLIKTNGTPVKWVSFRIKTFRICMFIQTYISLEKKHAWHHV